MRHYYRIIHLWPKQFRTPSIGGVDFTFSLQVRAQGNVIDVATIVDRYPMEVVYSKDSSPPNTLCVRNSDWGEQVTAPCDEWLVSMGFLMLCHNTETDRLFRKPEDEFETVFSGSILMGERLRDSLAP